MKKILLILFFGIAIRSYAQTKITGTWEGKITPQLRIVFHFDHQPGGEIFGTLDSPDQGVTGLALNHAVVKGDSLYTELNAAKMRYQAIFLNDSTLSGDWLQGPSRTVLLLHKKTSASGISIPNRPQTPKPPFNYNVEEVEYENADKSVHLAGTLTYPKTGHHFGAAILITGSGLQDRDETIFFHKPFAIIADYLTKNGWAVLRVDDRTMGKSTGDVLHATSADFADDVLSGIRYLKTRSEIDSNKIGLIGHSEGGLIAPIVYSKWPHLGFIISLAGTGVSGADILLRQQTDAMKTQAASHAALDSFYSLTKQTLFIIHDNPRDKDSSLLQKISTSYENWRAALPDTVVSDLHVKGVTGAMYARQTAPELQPWLRYFISTEPATFWEKVKCPVLALNGAMDIQVYPNDNIPAITEALGKAHNKNVSTKILPGLNHLFQHCKTCTFDEYKTLEESFAPEVLELMAQWLQTNVASVKKEAAK